MKISNQIADIQIDNIIELSRNLLSDSRFVNALEESNESSGKYFSSNQSGNLERVCSSVLSQDMMIRDMVVLNLTGKLYGYTNDTAKSRNFRSVGAIEKECLPALQEAEGKEVFFTGNVVNPEQTESFSMGKQINSIKTGETLGYLIINIRKNLLYEAFKVYDKGYESLCCMAADQKNGEIVYLTGQEEYQEEVMQAYEETGRLDKNYITAELENRYTGWKLISAVKKTEISRESYLIGGLICITVFILIAMSFVISRHISEWIYRPLNTLEETIQEVGEGNRHITREFDESEIGKIGNKFKTMVNNNLELREHLLSSQLKERESELLLLQSQINPHFLYNTLDSLYCMAVIHEADDMAEMVDALSQTFRLSLNNGNKLILAKDEMEHVKSYMKVQNFRYGDRFTLYLEMEEEVKKCYILKFILQPFVENAMYHGLEPKMGTGSIRVTGRKLGEDLVFTVEDNGVGMEDISGLNKGYGVRNVKERIALYYGEGYGVEFESYPGKGTKVTIKISAVYAKGEIHDEKSGNR